jgi:hypothetical protein
MGEPWQIRFDGGHQQRYLPDRVAVLQYVLAIGPRSPHSRFEVYAAREAAPLPNGSPGGRCYALAEVIDLATPGERDRIAAELAAGPGEPT